MQHYYNLVCLELPNDRSSTAWHYHWVCGPWGESTWLQEGRPHDDDSSGLTDVQTSRGLSVGQTLAKEQLQSLPHDQATVSEGCAQQEATGGGALNRAKAEGGLRQPVLVSADPLCCSLWSAEQGRSDLCYREPLFVEDMELIRSIVMGRG